MKKIIRLLILTAAVLICSIFLVSCNRAINEGKGHLWTAFRIESMEKGKAVFVRDCLDCGKSEKYRYAPSEGLEYTEDENGNVNVSGIGKFNDDFLYIPSVDELGRKVVGIADNAFDGNDIIRYVYVSDGIESIGDYSFVGCGSLLSVRLPDDAKYLGIYAFYESMSLYAVNIPDGIDEIGEYVFGGCFSLREISLPQGITKIGNGAFSRCRSIRELVLPEGCTGIGRYSFDDCASLEKISLGNIESVPEGAFSACIKLRSIELPSSVRSVETKSFIGCPMLERIYLPGSVERIGVANGESPFYLCGYKKLTVYCECDEPPIGWEIGFNICDYSSPTGDDEDIVAEFVYSTPADEFRRLDS